MQMLAELQSVLLKAEIKGEYVHLCVCRSAHFVFERRKAH